ncbi:hypothetical protein BH11PSE13_BH11PSE13_12420 [soil metagenome]
MNASCECLSELQKAHRLIVLMLNELSPAAKTRYIAKADRAGLIVEGATRHHERAAAIDKATGAAGCCRSTPCQHPGAGPCDMPAKATRSAA